MPYIKQESRDTCYEIGDVATPGELNYFFTIAILSYLGSNPNYQKFNDVIGALECCKLELYRRMIVPYETKKIQENGDVY